MRGCLLTLSLFVLIIVGFMVGLVASQPGLMILGFFISPVVFLMAGWTARGLFNGRRLSFVEVERERGAVVSTGQRVRRVQTQGERPPLEQTL